MEETLAKEQMPQPEPQPPPLPYHGEERRGRTQGDYKSEERRRALALSDLDTDQEPDQSPVQAPAGVFTRGSRAAPG